MLTKEKLKEQLRAIGVGEGMDLMMHSSLKRVGKVEGGADTIIDALLEILGPEGTLMMSTVSGAVTPLQPVFHSRYTPSSVGALSNVFRMREGVVRSLHPVHSLAAFGPKAEFYTEGHLDCATPWSPDSPYGKLLRNGAKILFYGVDFACNTCLHALEIEARMVGIHTRETTTLYVYDDNDVKRTIEHHWHAKKKSYYPSLEYIVEKAGGLTYGVIGNGISRFVDAGILYESLLPVFKDTPELATVRLSDNDFIWE
jgi:aminoglycoside 3-N-acetyltransferase